MKKMIVILGVALCGLTSQAQSPGTVSLNVYAGYTFDEKVPFDYVDVKVPGGLQYGGGLEYYVRPSKSIELKYNRLDTDISASGYLYGDINNFRTASLKSSINLILIGGNNYFIQGTGKAIPYIGAALGVGIIDGPDYSGTTNFAWDIHAGVKIKTESAVAVKLQTYLQSTLGSYGSDTYWDPWYGPIAVPDYHRILQFGLGAIVEFNFKH